MSIIGNIIQKKKTRICVSPFVIREITEESLAKLKEYELAKNRHLAIDAMQKEGYINTSPQYWEKDYLCIEQTLFVVHPKNLPFFTDLEKKIDALEAKCKRYEKALILITENSLYCDHCSASLYAKEALEQREGGG